MEQPPEVRRVYLPLLQDVKDRELDPVVGRKGDIGVGPSVSVPRVSGPTGKDGGDGYRILRCTHTTGPIVVGVGRVGGKVLVPREDEGRRREEGHVSPRWSSGVRVRSRPGTPPRQSGRVTEFI